MKKVIKSSDSVFASSFNRVVGFMNKYPCCFITAWREYDETGEKLSNNEKRARNKQLESDIRASGLTFYKARGGFVEDGGNQVTEDTFCVVDNRYPEDKFIKLCVSWCSKYNQESVLITMPNGTNDSAINVTGAYYNGDGNIEVEFDNASVKDVERYFTNICGKNFVLSAHELTTTKGHDIRSVSGRLLGDKDFEAIYGDSI